MASCTSATASPSRSRLYRQRRGSVARRGAGHRLARRSHHRDDAGPIFQRRARVARVILEPQVRHSQPRSQTLNRVQGRPTNRQWRSRILAIGYRQESAVTPHRRITISCQGLAADMPRNLLIVIMDFKHTQRAAGGTAIGNLCDAVASTAKHTLQVFDVIHRCPISGSPRV